MDIRQSLQSPIANRQEPIANRQEPIVNRQSSIAKSRLDLMAAWAGQ
jgi:hypothetical protein